MAVLRPRKIQLRSGGQPRGTAAPVMAESDRPGVGSSGWLAASPDRNDKDSEANTKNTKNTGDFALRCHTWGTAACGAHPARRRAFADLRSDGRGLAAATLSGSADGTAGAAAAAAACSKPLGACARARRRARVGLPQRVLEHVGQQAHHFLCPRLAGQQGRAAGRCALDRSAQRMQNGLCTHQRPRRRVVRRCPRAAAGPGPLAARRSSDGAGFVQHGAALRPQQRELDDLRRARENGSRCSRRGFAACSP
jgi:hypothetical protein